MSRPNPTKSGQLPLCQLHSHKLLINMQKEWSTCYEENIHLNKTTVNITLSLRRMGLEISRRGYTKSTFGAKRPNLFKQIQNISLNLTKSFAPFCNFHSHKDGYISKFIQHQKQIYTTGKERQWREKEKSKCMDIGKPSHKKCIKFI